MTTSIRTTVLDETPLDQDGLDQNGLDQDGLERLARLVACELMPCDVVALRGDLGAGKSTFARAAIRARLGDDEAEVPSPTFSLVQTYDAAGGSISHCDLYRLDGEDAAAELGLDEALTRGSLLVEWPERAPSFVADLSADRLDITLTEADGGERRIVRMTGHGRWASRLPRMAEIEAFIAANGWGAALPVPMAGDASSRRYLRLMDGNRNSEGRRALVMDAPRMPDGPPIRDGKPYSRIAHIAEDVRPFVAIARHLRGLGLSAPTILAADLDGGLLLTEDLGHRVYGDELQRGASQLELWRAAVDALLTLHASPVSRTLPIGNGETHHVPDFDLTAMQIEIELLPDWYVPMLSGAALPLAERERFLVLWQPVLQRLCAEPPTLLLRDFHSPNLIWLPERTGVGNVGIIDFQDAMIGSAAYDLVSVLQDARLDVPEAVEAELLAHYCSCARTMLPQFDEGRFAFAYRAFGAERNTKILGIFARLARRDGKPRYLQHIPRIWGYLERDLAHPELCALRSWYDLMFPAHLRRTLPGAASR